VIILAKNNHYLKCDDICEYFTSFSWHLCLELLPYLRREIFHQDNLGGFHPPRLSTAQDDMLFFLEVLFLLFSFQN